MSNVVKNAIILGFIHDIFYLHDTINFYTDWFLLNIKQAEGPLWSWYGNWIYNYLCNQCLSSLSLWVRIPVGWCILDAKLCDNVRQLLVTGRWFSSATSVSSSNKTDRHDLTEILLKVALNTILTTINFLFIIDMSI